MRYFSHYMAVRSNDEDQIQGHFWESRFGSDVLENEASILTCMIYVDLNPIRAQIANTPEESDFTGPKDRIDDLRISLGTTDLGATSLTLTSSELSLHDWERLSSVTNEHSGWLSPIEIDEASDPLGPDPELPKPDSQPFSRRASRKGALAISLPRYLQLLDWVGQTSRNDKRGSVPSDLAPILSRLGLTGSELVAQMWKFGLPEGSVCLNIQLNSAPPGPIPVNTSNNQLRLIFFLVSPKDRTGARQTGPKPEEIR